METQQLPSGATGYYDLAYVSNGHERQKLADSPESELIGGLIQENKEKVARCNPITYVTGEAPPFLIVHGDQDPLVPYGQSVLLVEALQKAGVDVTFYTVAGSGHGHFTDPQVPELTKAFLTKWVAPC